MMRYIEPLPDGRFYKAFDGCYGASPAMGAVVVDLGLSRMGFEPFEVERRAFLQRHHHLINPRLYSTVDRIALDRAVLVEGWEQAERRGREALFYGDPLPSEP